MFTADHNLLLGLTALQTEFIDRDMLVEALMLWKAEKARNLLQILLDQGHLDQRQAELLENLAQEHMRRNGGSPEQGLAALSNFSTVVPIIQEINDPDIYATIENVTQSRLAKQTQAGGHFASTIHKDSSGEASPSKLNKDSASTVAQLPPVSMLGNSRNRFRVLRMHARGGLGQVYLAEDEELHRNVALKEIISKYADEPENRQRFMVEAEITGRLQHPGIVPVYGLGIYPDGRPFYAMRFIEGDNLLTAIRSFHHLAQGKAWAGDLMVAFRELLGRFMDVCDAMQFAHDRHVLHRDLKPHNIMLGEHGETLVVDWGLAKPLYEGQSSSSAPEEAIIPVSGSASGSEREGSILGTPDYMPPEQAAGRLSQLSVRSDVYSLGATLFHLLTNQPPFQPRSDANKPDSSQPRISIEKLLQRVQAGEFEKPYTLNPKVGKPLSAICAKAMALRPEDRYESARELKMEIQRYLADEPIKAMPQHWYDRAYRWFRRHKQLTIIGGAALLVVAVTSVLAAIAINHFRNREVIAANISLYSSQLDGLLLQSQADGQPLDEKFFVSKFDPILQRLRPLDPPAASRLELRSLQNAAEDIQFRLTEKTPSEQEITQISADIDYWSDRILGYRDEMDSVETELRDLLENRRASWNRLERLTGKSLTSAFSESDQFTTQDDGEITLANPSNRHSFHQLVVPQLPQNLNHDISVRFSIKSLQQPAIAIALNPQADFPEENQYQAVLCVDNFRPNVWNRRLLEDLETLHEAASNGKPVRLLIARGRTVLSEARVNVGLGDVTLSLRRSDERLRATVEPQVGDTQQIEFEDFLTLPYGTQPGVWFGSDTAISSINLSYRTRPSQLSSIESIKELIGAQKFEEAQTQLSKMTGGEADYLRSTCLLQPSDRIALLDKVLERTPRYDESEKIIDRWYLPALIDAIRLNREQNNDERFRDLILKLKFNYGTNIDEVALRMPEELRQDMLREFRKLGGRWRIASQATGDTPMLDTAVHLDSVLETDEAMKRATRWRRCDAWRVAGREQDATRELLLLLNESLQDHGAPAGEAANLITDISWVMLAYSKLNELEDFLAELKTNDKLDADAQHAVQLESGRLAIHQKRLADAGEIFNELFAIGSELRLAQYVDLCLLAGFVQADLGNEPAAQELWLRGLEFNGKPIELINPGVAGLHGTESVEHQCIVTLYGTLASLTNSFTEKTAKDSFDAQVPKDAGFGNAGIDIVETAFPTGLIRDLANATYRSDRGRAIARRRAYHLVGLAPYFNEPIRLLVFEGVVVRHFNEYRSDQSLMEDAWNACDQLFLTYDAGNITEKADMRQIIMLWSGEAGLEIWQALEPKLTRNVAAGLALVSAKAHLSNAESAKTEASKITHLRNARIMLELTRDHNGSTDNFRKLASQLLANLPAEETLNE